MAQTVPLTTLYSDLNRFNQNQEFDRALKVANKILQESPNEAAAFHCKVVCLMKQDKYNDALTVIHKTKPLSGSLRFEKAYCEYRLNRTQEACTTLKSIESPDYKAKELLAQVLYRLEQYEECFELYKELIKNSNDEFDEERETNLSAVLASLTLWDKKEVGDPGLRENSYELCYNHACYLLGKGDLKAAEMKLRRAEVFGRKTYEDDPDMTEEDIEEELAITRVQLAYVLQKQGRVEEATQIYNQVLKHNVGSWDLKVYTTGKKYQIMYDVFQFFSAITQTSCMRSLLQPITNIPHNHSAVHIHTHILKISPPLKKKVKVSASYFAKYKIYSSGYADKYPDQCVGIQLLIAQLQLMQGCVSQACKALRSLSDFQYRPGVVSALVTLYQSLEDVSGASEVLNDAIKWYRSNKPNSPDLATLIRANSNFQTKYGSPKTAAEMLEELYRLHPDDPHILAKLIAAYSQFDPVKAQNMSKELPSVEELAKNVDVDALEASFSTLGAKYMKKTQKVEPSPGPSGDMLLKKKKKKKKGKVPQNCDPGVTPDPERWIPRKERSYYRGKRKDRKKDIGKGTQGATGPAGDMDASRVYNAATDAGSPRPGSAPVKGSPQAGVAPPQQVGPRQQKPAQANKKKKKKGGNKW
ncbi:hypothetical protein ScPMuIL_007153 [Solemya velum]